MLNIKKSINKNKPYFEIPKDAWYGLLTWLQCNDIELTGLIL